TWGSPVAVAARTAGVDFDKTWIVCDDTPTSPFYGRCYASWQNGNSGRFTLTTSDDGGLHWSALVQTARAASGDGTQPLVQPSGRVVVTATSPDKSAIVAFTSDDGGATWTAPVTVSAATDRPQAGLRSEPLPSAEMDASGRVYVAWQDCRFRSGC